MKTKEQIQIKLEELKKEIAINEEILLSALYSEVDMEDNYDTDAYSPEDITDIRNEGDILFVQKILLEWVLKEDE